MLPEDWLIVVGNHEGCPARKSEIETGCLRASLFLSAAERYQSIKYQRDHREDSTVSRSISA